MLAQRPLHERGRRDDGNAPERVEHEEIIVAGHDEIGAAVDRQVEKFVIGRITALCDVLDDRHQLSLGEDAADGFPEYR